MHAQARTFAEDHVKVVRRREVILFAAEAEVIFTTAQVAEPGQVVNEQEKLRSLAGVRLLAQGQLAFRSVPSDVAARAYLPGYGCPASVASSPAQNSKLALISRSVPGPD